MPVPLVLMWMLHNRTGVSLFNVSSGDIQHFIDLDYKTLKLMGGVWNYCTLFILVCDIIIIMILHMKQFFELHRAILHDKLKVASHTEVSRTWLTKSVGWGTDASQAACTGQWRVIRHVLNRGKLFGAFLVQGAGNAYTHLHFFCVCLSTASWRCGLWQL